MSLNTEAQTRTSVRHKSAIITPSPSVMIWNLKHSPQLFHRVSLPSPHLHKLHVLLSPSLSPMCQVHLAWLWTPRCHILLKALLVEARILHNAGRWDHALEMWALAHEGRGGWKENRKRWGRPAHVSLCFEGLCRSFYFAFHSWLQLAAKEKLQASLPSIRALNDCCSLICFLPTVLQTDIIMSPPYLTAGIMPLNLCGFYFKLQYNLAFSM